MDMQINWPVISGSSNNMQINWHLIELTGQEYA